MEENRTRLSKTGVCLLAVGIYLGARMFVPMVSTERLNPDLVVLTTVLVMMLLQLALVASIVRLGMEPRKSALWMLLCVVVFVGLLILVLGAKLTLPGVAVLGLSAVLQLSLLLVAVFLGITVSHIIRERNLLLPVAIVAALVDFWNVYIGPLGHVVETKPQIVNAVTIHMPMPVAGAPMPMIGMGDFVFLALYFSVVYRFGMNVKGTFWWGYVLLTITMLAVLGPIGAVPALVPMAIAVIGANAREFKLSRQELLATIGIGLILVALITASGAYMLRKQAADHAGKPRTTDSSPQSDRPAGH